MKKNICLHTAFWCLFLFIYNSVQATPLTEGCAFIASIAGRVEVKKAGTNTWGFAKVKQKLFDNDMLRTYKGAKTKIMYDDGSIIIVREETQILLNTKTAEKQGGASKYITAFWGAVFFVFKEAAPRAQSNRVFTPTAVVSIRGTSFLVTVDRKTGRTDVKVVNGTVLVRNKSMDRELFVKAGTKTTVAVNKTPARPRAIIPEEIIELKKWAGDELVSAEQAKQQRQNRRNAVVMSGKAEDKIAVVTFVDSSGFSGKWDIATGLTNMIADKLRGLTKAEVVVFKGKENDAEKIGKRERARLVVSGVIETFELNKQAAISIEADKYKEYYRAGVAIILYVVDPLNGRLVKTVRFKEDVDGGNLQENDWKVVGKYVFDMNNKNFNKSIIGQAIKRILNRCALELRDYL